MAKASKKSPEEKLRVVLSVLRSTPRADMAACVARLKAHEITATPAAAALADLRCLFGTLAAPGVARATRAAGPNVDPASFGASITALTFQLLEDLSPGAPPQDPGIGPPLSRTAPRHVAMRAVARPLSHRRRAPAAPRSRRRGAARRDAAGQPRGSGVPPRMPRSGPPRLGAEGAAAAAESPSRPTGRVPPASHTRAHRRPGPHPRGRRTPACSSRHSSSALSCPPGAAAGVGSWFAYQSATALVASARRRA